LAKYDPTFVPSRIEKAKKISKKTTEHDETLASLDQMQPRPCYFIIGLMKDTAV
jgi:hypothetical protein